jgi:predicted GIY-YIG superfamily endonuclease
MSFNLKLYLLELANDKYYVGQTQNPDYRFHEHSRGRGAKWTCLHKPLRILLTKEVTVRGCREAMLQENWMTLKMMERFGWENVRGGDFVRIEAIQLSALLGHIYDLKQNKIRYYIPDCPYLFGTGDEWHVYVLELADNHYYIGSCKSLGKTLGEHFDGKSIEWTRQHPVVRVAELVTMKERYLEVKNKMVLDYIARFGRDRVLGGQMPKKK